MLRSQPKFVEATQRDATQRMVQEVGQPGVVSSAEQKNSREKHVSEPAGFRKHWIWVPTSARTNQHQLQEN